METLALVTVDRGDRGFLYEHCLKQVSNFPVSLDHIKIVRPPKSSQPDLTERMIEAYDIAVDKGYSWLIVIESDDFYPQDYILRMWQHFDASDFIGSEFTYYYNLRNRTWERSMHPNHSSLFCTAFRVSAMKDFKWKLAHKVFLDLDIWRYARKNNLRRTFIDTGAIGIKHGTGLCGGRGHVQKFKNTDSDLLWLKSKVDEKSFDFYGKLELV
jgi:hypothetical protein